ncbi:KIN14B-interacting protein At4g14310-like [Cucurbita pepo subsp. pepo]|uniref:KIN14B-interacting protein At4g14310-like n=1 Tax=Cucurbita pepo subsp. pepo TaxID=3664 RepID=UPI000C9D830D|nr:KIN14B-interacting protein At4g14310-like [Cucurbita pepo subsp. pepo]
MSARRLRDRSGGSAAIKPSKPVTPLSCSNQKTNSDSSCRFSSAGKENPKSTPKLPMMAQKPSIRAVPRVNKAAAIAVNDGESRARWSTSSVPRGRSSSPSEFIRGSVDSRRERRVSVDRVRGSVGENYQTAGGRGSSVRGSDSDKTKVGVKDLDVMVGGGGLTGLRVYRELKENVKLRANMDGKNRISEANQPPDEEKIEGKPLGFKVLGCHSGEAIDDALRSDGNGKSSIVPEKVQRVSIINEEEEEKPSLKSEKKDLEIIKEGGQIGGEGTSSCTSNKYPSKLHEKLAFLEGKVKRIASDIKKTKEMLDLNNTSSSKLILTDIQEKISGIEKAMGHGAAGSGVKLGLTSKNDRDTKMVLKDETKEADVNTSVKGINTKELEERLFPHHQLLRNRMSMKSTSDSSKSNEVHGVKVEDMPIDENPIALEFLASLNKEQTKVTMRSEQVGMEFCEVQEMDENTSSGLRESSTQFKGKQEAEVILTSDEILDDFDDRENKQGGLIGEETDDTSTYQMNEIGTKTSTGGWFVSEGEAVLLAHNDGSCSFYDITNTEEKSVYKPPAGISPNIWRDCWIIRAAGADGCSGRYVVAASAGNTMDAGFCSWDFYSKNVRAFQIEGAMTSSRTALAPLPHNIVQKRYAPSYMLVPETEQWWYKPCGPLIISTATCQKTVKVFDVRDSDEIMNWEVQKPVAAMDYSSPLQWRNRGKVVVAETEAISLWDVASTSAQALLSVYSPGCKISALHVNNTDAELGGGVRQRISSAEAEGNDGVFCTTDSVNILDFRSPSGIGLKLPKASLGAQSVFSRGDSVYVGCSSVRPGGKKQPSSVVHQFSIRKQGLFCTYALPETNAHVHHTAVTQVWGNSNLVMAVCGLGLFVFDALNDDVSQSSSVDPEGTQVAVKEVVGPDDLYSPSFDYSTSRALLISRDRPALWKQLP